MNTVTTKKTHDRRTPFLISLLSGMILIATLLSQTGVAAEQRKHFNRLSQEKSPYLLQHKDNPIWWYPWGEEAFRAAREENKPIFLSIGYSSCHWCHVMEQDSFTKQDVADLLNQHFIAIKVDREERPDVDQIYMDVLIALNGSGGWPVSMFITPDRVPFFGATYVPREHFIGMLKNIHEAWTQDQKKIKMISQKVTEWLKKQNQRGLDGAPLPDETVLQRFMKTSVMTYDPVYGGFGTEPKFPNSIRLAVLLRIYQRTQEPQSLKMVQKALDGMARGGIYDHLGGGFHRYATDQAWQIPHFEKMLYDNALLAMIYLEAFQVTHHNEYALIARGILDYVLRDMTHPHGGFYSAEDADSENIEGKFYLWTEAELQKLLNPIQFRLISRYYNIRAEGNWQLSPEALETEKKAGLETMQKANIFFMDLTQEWPDGTIPQFKTAREKLLQVRSQRLRPLKDDKILTAWNGLMISAMAKGYQVLEEKTYLKAAQHAARFILKELRGKDGMLLRRWKDQDARYNAYLSDYAYFIQSLITLYQSDFDPSWIHEAVALQAKQDQRLWHEEEGIYYFSDDSDPTLIQRHKPVADNVLPSGNAVTAGNLLMLADLVLDLNMKSRAKRMIGNQGLQLLDNPVLHAQMVVALDYLLDRSKEIAIIGHANADTQAIIQKFRQLFLPNAVIAMGPPAEQEAQIKNSLPLLVNKPMLQGKPTIYVCENNVCQLPTTDINKAIELIRANKPYQL